MQISISFPLSDRDAATFKALYHRHHAQPYFARGDYDPRGLLALRDAGLLRITFAYGIPGEFYVFTRCGNAAGLALHNES